MSQSLPCKPRSLARAAPILAEEPPPLELPKSSPAYEPFEDYTKGRTLIRYSAEISAKEFSCSPSERQEFLSQSCPNWSSFHLPKDPTSVEPLRRERQELFHSNAGALDMPSKGSPGSNFLETEVTMMGKSPTILESFKLISRREVDDNEHFGVSRRHSLDNIMEETVAAAVDDEDEDQFSLEA